MTVSELVKKYKEQFSSEKRPHLRRRLRTEKPELFKNNPSNRRKLDRCLRKEFANEPNSKKTGVIIPNSVVSLQKCDWNPAPDFAFSPNFVEAHRRIRETYEVDDDPAQFPRVPFNWRNLSPYQLIVRLEVRVFLGGRFLSIINDLKEYYNGKANIPVEPSRGIRDGSFTLPPECTASKEETTIEVHARIFDQNCAKRQEYQITRSWSYDPKKKEWFHEPRCFTVGPMNPIKASSWDSLIETFSNIGANLIEIEIEKHSLGNRTNVQGIMMLKGAKTMQEAAKMDVPEEYEGFLFTQASVNEEDKLTWQGIRYKIKKVERIDDGYVPSHNIAKLVKPFVPWAVG